MAHHLHLAVKVHGYGNGLAPAVAVAAGRRGGDGDAGNLGAPRLGRLRGPQPEKRCGHGHRGQNRERVPGQAAARHFAPPPPRDWVVFSGEFQSVLLVCWFPLPLGSGAGAGTTGWGSGDRTTSRMTLPTTHRGSPGSPACGPGAAGRSLHCRARRGPWRRLAASPRWPGWRWPPRRPPAPCR